MREIIARFDEEDKSAFVYGEEVGEIVRCNDCKHYRNNKCDQLSLLIFLLGNDEDDYCSHAERKEE